MGADVMTKYLRTIVTLVALMAGGGSVGAQPAPDPRVADLAKAGQLRVGLFPPQYVKDATTGELKGVWAETARALAKRIGVRAVLLEHPTPVKAAECLKAGLCDAVILGLAPRSAEAGDLSAPFLQFDFTFLVPGGSQIQNITELDRPGTRIAAVRDHLSTLALAKLIKQAELAYGESPDSTFDLLRTEKAVAFASTRPALMDYLKRLPGSRVLETSYGENLQSIVVQKGHAGHLAYVSEFLDEAKVSGWLQATIERSGPPGIKVVPKGN
jgi:polar amino acid transport system substrate-binding protein